MKNRYELERRMRMMEIKWLEKKYTPVMGRKEKWSAEEQNKKGDSRKSHQQTT